MYDSKFEEIAAIVASGKCVLFIGAGISIGAGLPGWQDLIDKLKDELPGTDQSDWLTIAQVYEERFGRSALEEKIKKLTDTTGKNPSSVHRLLPSLGIDVWVTTNYDNFLERVLSETGQPFCVIVEDKDLPDVNPRARTLIKLHGDTNRPETIIFTKNDFFLSQETRDLVWKKIGVYLAERSFLFLGYSVNDPDLSQIQASLIRRLTRHRVPQSYAIMTTSDEIRIQDLASRKVEVVDLSKSGFADPTETLCAVLDDLINRIRTYPSIGAECHRAGAASIVPGQVIANLESEGFRLVLCIEYRVYCDYLDGGQFNSIPPGWKPVIPWKLRQAKYHIERYRRSDSSCSNIWEGIAVGKRRHNDWVQPIAQEAGSG
jgi:hypothetical protein